MKRKRKPPVKNPLGSWVSFSLSRHWLDEQYDRIRNLNDVHMNEAFADIYYCEKDDRRYVISVKARNKYMKNGRLNSQYNLGSNAYKKAERVMKWGELYETATIPEHYRSGMAAASA